MNYNFVSNGYECCTTDMWLAMEWADTMDWKTQQDWAENGYNTCWNGPDGYTEGCAHG